MGIAGIPTNVFADSWLEF